MAFINPLQIRFHGLVATVKVYQNQGYLGRLVLELVLPPFLGVLSLPHAWNRYLVIAVVVFFDVFDHRLIIRTLSV
jgi:hypothetical protein